MRFSRLLLATAIVISLSSPLAALVAKPKISMELVTEEGFSITGAQPWYKMITGLGVSSLQIRSAQAKDELAIEKQGATIKVVGFLKADNTLTLPGGKFTSHDNAKLKKWIADVQDQGPDGVIQPKIAFGLLPKQLEEVTNDLKQPLTFSTKGTPAKDTLDKIQNQLKLTMTIDRAAAAAIAQVTVEDELMGLSSGTALAAILRPAGLVLAPERPAGGKVQYNVVKGTAGRQAWPVGWKPEQTPSKVMPELFKMINVEVEDQPLLEVLNPIQERLAIPFLFDHNALAMHKIDPSQGKANVPGKKLSYSLILNKVLHQSGLKFELRTDEAGNKFLWITSVKPS